MVIWSPKRFPARKLLPGLLLLPILAVQACSSVPNFRPSKPIEEASSLDEAIELCAAYQIDGAKSSEGRAVYERTVVLVPWINCFESVFRKTRGARERESFVMFFRSLQARHDSSLTGEDRVIDWPAMNSAVKHAVEHINAPSLNYSDEESATIGHELPDYWIWLSENHLLRGVVHPGKSAPRILREDEDARRLPPRPLPLTAEQRNYCKTYLEYQSLMYNLGELADYKRVLESQTREDVGNPNERAMRNRVDTRYEALKKEAAEKQQQLAGELTSLQGKSSWFRNGYCLEQKVGRLKKTK